MDAGDALRGADANPGRAVADLRLQVAQLTQMLQSGVKMETVSPSLFLTQPKLRYSTSYPY